MGNGLLHLVNLTGAEQQTYIRFAAALDDAEAQTLACAAHRGHSIVTDDRATLRYAAALSPPVATVTTPVWVKAWADVSRVPDPGVAEVVRRIGVRARYRPPDAHPLKPWWDQLFHA